MLNKGAFLLSPLLGSWHVSSITPSPLFTHLFYNHPSLYLIMAKYTRRDYKRSSLYVFSSFMYNLKFYLTSFRAFFSNFLTYLLNMSNVNKLTHITISQLFSLYLYYKVRIYKLASYVV